MPYPNAEEFESLSKNQKAFVNSCHRRGFEVRSYSGKFMNGRYCPSIIISKVDELPVFGSEVWLDELGRNLVIYAKD